MHAGIAMSDMLSACTVGFVRGNLCLDVNQSEVNDGGAYIPMVIKARSEEVVFIQLDSTLSFELLETAMSTAIAGCRQIRQYLEGAIKKHMMEQVNATNHKLQS